MKYKACRLRRDERRGRTTLTENKETRGPSHWLLKKLPREQASSSQGR
jgi:hypothetical protein